MIENTEVAKRLDVRKKALNKLELAFQENKKRSGELINEIVQMQGRIAELKSWLQEDAKDVSDK